MAEQKSTEPCYACDGGRDIRAEPWTDNACSWCGGTLIYQVRECPPGTHDSLDEALGCNTCQFAANGRHFYKKRLRALFGRGSKESPCEECGASEGHFLENGFQRCKKCGFPGK